MPYLRVCRLLSCLLCLIVLPLISAGSASAAGESAKTWRWNGHPFVFVLMTDDGTKCNLDWAEVARQKDMRFTISINSSVRDHPKKLTPVELQGLAAEGFEIANHGYGHGHTGVPTDCPIPPRGSLLAYFMCDGFEPGEAEVYFQAEIERDSVAALVEIEPCQVRTLAYPNHRHSKAVIAALIEEGYIGARYGENSSYSTFSYGDFTVPARNSWEGGISLFRVPVAHYTTVFFGDHSADPPVHFTYEEFVTATQPYIDQAVADGGMFVIYSHHFGDDDDAYGDINYHSAGMSCQDLAWMVDLVRANGGTVMTFGDAVAYYRGRTECVDLGGDLVWKPMPTGVESLPALSCAVAAAPNPFNAHTDLRVRIDQDDEIDVSIFDLAGRRVCCVYNGFGSCGEHSYGWDGCTDGGDVVASGVYRALLHTTHGESETRVTLLK